MANEIARSKRLIALYNEKKRAEEAKRIFELLPQGPDSGLNADLLDNLHLSEVIEKARKSIVVKAGGGGARGVTDHGLLSGLGDDDHTQYLLVDGSRAMTGNLEVQVENSALGQIIAKVDSNKIARYFSRKTTDNLVSLFGYNENYDIIFLGSSTRDLAVYGTKLDFKYTGIDGLVINPDVFDVNAVGNLFWTSPAKFGSFAVYLVTAPMAMKRILTQDDLGISQDVDILDGDGVTTHHLVFTNGILTSYSTS